MTGAQNQHRQRVNARWRQWPSSASEYRHLELGASAPFNCFVTVECVKDPNVQECADAPDCKLCCSMRQHPAFRTLTKTLIINSTQLSATCIFTILPNLGFAIDLCSQIQNTNSSSVSFLIRTVAMVKILKR
jgi:hypothetical protein